MDSASLYPVNSTSLPIVDSASLPQVDSTPPGKWTAYGSAREPPAEGKAAEAVAGLSPTHMFAEKCLNGSNYLIVSDKWFSHPSVFLHLSFSFSALWFSSRLPRRAATDNA
ncbi:MAG: hypothetical protein K2N13_08260 [Paraprevotella sp.]|nr:hypothetical protein [Paraprevotella sp.]